MKEIKVVRKAESTEEIYLDFARKVSEIKDGAVIFSYPFLQFLFQYAPYEELDSVKIDMNYRDEEQKVKSVIALKSGMTLTFTRVRMTTYVYLLHSLEFNWNGEEIIYNCSKHINEISECYKIADE